MTCGEGLSSEERIRVRHDLSAIVAVLKTALAMVENGDEVRVDLEMMLGGSRQRLGAILDSIQKPVS